MSEPYIGQVYLVGYNFAQRAFALCQGQLLPIAQNTAMFSLLGTTFGGDGRTTFGLPDLQGRTPIGQGSGAGLTPRQMGQKGGSEVHVLNTLEMPSHTHPAVFTSKNLVAQGNLGDQRSPDGNFIAGDSGGNLNYTATNASSVNMNAESLNLAVTNGNVGGSQAHNIMQPWLVMNYEIALQGLFPSRS